MKPIVKLVGTLMMTTLLAGCSGQEVFRLSEQVHQAVDYSSAVDELQELHHRILNGEEVTTLRSLADDAHHHDDGHETAHQSGPEGLGGIPRDDVEHHRGTQDQEINIFLAFHDLVQSLPRLAADSDRSREDWEAIDGLTNEMLIQMAFAQLAGYRPDECRRRYQSSADAIHDLLVQLQAYR